MAGGLAPETVDAFLSLPEDSQRGALGQMSPDTKQLLLGALQAKTNVASAVASVPRPAAPEGLTPPTDFMSRVGESMKSRVYAVPNAIDQMRGVTPTSPAEAASAKESVLGPWQGSTLGKMAGPLTYGPRMLYGMAKGYVKDPASAVGDIALAAPELAEHVPDLDRLGVPGTKWGRGAAIPPPPGAEPALPPLTEEQQAKYTADLDKANASYAKQAKAHGAYQRQQAIAADLQSGVGNVHQQTQQLYQQHRAALDAGWDEMRKVVGTETPTPVKGIVDAIREAEEKDLRGAPGQVKQFKDLLTELGMNDYVEGEKGELNPHQDAPWQTVRTHSSAIGRALSQGNLPGNVYQALKRVAGATDAALTGVAESRGYGNEYRALKSTEARFRKDFEDLGPISTGEGNPAARVVKSPTPTFASTHILGKAGDILSDTLRRWDPTGKLANEVDRLRGLQEESKSLPKTRTAPPEPVLAKVERPEPEPPKPSPLTKHAIRAAGGIAGAALASPLGHPWYGAIGGSQAAAALYEYYLRHQTPVIPPPPGTP